MSASTILTLHARYENAWIEYNKADAAQPAQPRSGDPELSRYFALESAMRRNAAESETLRSAVLYQVPATDEEATVLAFHCWGLFDEHGDLTETEKLALSEGLTSLFDYFVTQGRAATEKLGSQFSQGAHLAFDRRRLRTGQVEG